MAYSSEYSKEQPVADNFDSFLDYIATVGYDVDFLRGDIASTLAANPIAKAPGPEHFDPRSSPTGALAATGPWAARLLLGSGTFLDELAGKTTWSGSLDLPAAARRLSEMIALDAHIDELQGRSHLIGAFLAYGEAVLPPIFTSVLHPFMFETAMVVDVLDRYRERSWGQRLPVSRATLCMMKAVMEGARASLGVPPPEINQPCYAELAAEAISAIGAWDVYDSYLAKPSVDALYRLPRSVRLAFQPDRVGAHHVSRNVPEPTVPWLQCLRDIQPPLFPVLPVLTRAPPENPPARMPLVPDMEATRLNHTMVHSPSRPGGYAAGFRDFIGRPAGASTVCQNPDSVL